MKLGPDINKTMEAKAVAKDRQAPRPIKGVVVSYFEDDNGKPDKKRPHIVRTYLVHVADETVKVYDRYLNEHQIEAKAGDLDFSRGMTVCEQIYSPTNSEKPIAIVCLSHDQQFGVINSRWTVDREYGQTIPKRASRTNYSEDKIEFGPWFAKSPNALLPRFNIFRPDEDQTAVLALWRAEANSPDAFWVEGEPTLDQVQASDKAREERRAAAKARKTSGQPVQVSTEAGPGGVEDMGQEF